MLLCTLTSTEQLRLVILSALTPMRPLLLSSTELEGAVLRCLCGPARGRSWYYCSLQSKVPAAVYCACSYSHLIINSTLVHSLSDEHPCA